MQLTSTFPSTALMPTRYVPSPEAALSLLGPSAAMALLWNQVRRLAPHVRTVLLLGKADCGQEAVARLLLDLSPQNHRMFVELPAVEAEARLVRPAGLASLPGDVFLFLPDADRLSLPAQEALLRAMRLRRSRPFTVVAASSEDLRCLVSVGQFLPELAELLGAATLKLPTLDERKEDLPMLINQLLTAACRERGCVVPQVTEGFLRTAMQYSWPGNLCELSTILFSLSQRAKGQLLAEHLMGALSYAASPHGAISEPARLVPLNTVVSEHIDSVLRACRGNKLRAAEILGISRSTLYRMLDATATETAGSLQPAL